MLQSNIPDSPYPRVVIVGAGFAGINLVKTLHNKPFQVVLLDRNNFHTFQPLLYQVATAGLEPSSIAFPIRGIFRRKNKFIYRLAEVEDVSPDTHTLNTSIGPIRYDYLVIATGSVSNFFGNKNFETYGSGMKSLYEAVGIRNYGLKNIEQALLLKDRAAQEKALTIVIAGGGPTGVELAGALAEFRKTIFPQDYPELSADLMHIYLIEGAPRLLANMSEQASAQTHKFLAEMGVKIYLQTLVKDYDGEVVYLGNGEQIPTQSFIWSAGVKGNALPGLREEQIKGGRIEVDTFNLVKGCSNVYAIGDVALMTDNDHPKGYPMLAQVAIQQGKNLGANLVRRQNKEPLRPFSYRDKGTMATIGRNKAVTDIGKLHLHGFIAWVMWGVVHLMFLMGFRNKLVVFINWMYSYFTYDKGTRILLKRHI
ncbi:NAD(P)/FAD-dependent oxidoreductase [Compostibacter hankyongensis]|uniref:NADH:ubiquinone reductase (non-electrogenic) n=1 Tax=Compostibacter hankyongensis TaxID=1007089 RepID=A0ABP8FXD2_9BACT